MMPGMVMANGKEDLEEEEDGEEMYVDSLGQALDLFSPKTFPTAEECMEHCRDVHGLDLGVLAKRHAMDTFSFIRLVNYIRLEKPSPGFVMSLSSSQKWADSAFLKPQIPDDPLLMFDFDQELTTEAGGEEEEENGFEIDISRELNDQIAKNPETTAAGRLSPEVTEADNLSSSRLNCSGLLSSLPTEGEVTLPAAKLHEFRLQFEEVSLQMERMESVAQTLFVGNDDSNSQGAQRRSKKEVVPVSEARTVAEDHSYFESYAHFSIHHEMLSDVVRTSSYRDATLGNPGRLKGAVVMDLGCGTSILSMFSAQAGAKAVVGVDCSDIIYQAMDIVRENGLENKVTLVKGRLEETTLPHEKFDVIVSEWMGYFLLFEGMLDSVLAALSDVQRYKSLVGYWDDVYGFKMSCMRGPILGEANVEVVGAEHVVSNSQRVHDLDITTCTLADTEFSSDFSLEINRTCDLTAIVGYFDTFFELEERPVEFSTGPLATPTHWKQTVFYLPEVLPVVKDQVVSGKITCKRMSSDVRALKVALTLEGRQYRYTVD